MELPNAQQARELSTQNIGEMHEKAWDQTKKAIRRAIKVGAMQVNLEGKVDKIHQYFVAEHIRQKLMGRGYDFRMNDWGQPVVHWDGAEGDYANSQT